MGMLGEPSEIRLQTSAELLGLLLGQHGDKSTDALGGVNRICLPSEIDSRERAKARAVRVGNRVRPVYSVRPRVTPGLISVLGGVPYMSLT